MSIKEHSPDQHRPIGGYAVLSGLFVSLCGSFTAWMRVSGRTLPDRIDPSDLAIVTVATHKASRLIAKDRVMSSLRAPFTRFESDAGPGEVSESPRGRGLRRAIGELITCPFCLGMWVAAGFLAALVVAPRPTRWTASMLTVLSGADVLQIAYKKTEDAL